MTGLIKKILVSVERVSVKGFVYLVFVLLCLDDGLFVRIGLIKRITLGVTGNLFGN